MLIEQSSLKLWINPKERTIKEFKIASSKYSHHMMSESTPICRCRVLYLGSAVPRQSKDGLQGIQEPLRSLYPVEGAGEAKGIDSWLSVWSNGILLENVDENRKQVTRFFPIDSLHYCAAVRQVLIPERGNAHPEPKFLPLDSPFARTPRVQHPPIFAAILRRTTGIKVLECHSFICKREAAANALVRCCFHAYADNSYAKQIETGSSAPGSVYGTLGGKSSLTNGDTNGWTRAGSTTTLNSMGRHHQTNGNGNGIDDSYTVKNSKCKKVSNLLKCREYREVWSDLIIGLVTIVLYWKLVGDYCELSLKRKENLWLTMNRDLCCWNLKTRSLEKVELQGEKCKKNKISTWTFSNNFTTRMFRSRSLFENRNGLIAI